MNIHIEYEAEVPDDIIETDFCNKLNFHGKNNGVDCGGLIKGFPYMECKRFSVKLECWRERYKKCEACKTACAEALSTKKSEKTAKKP
ncbi:hypothetical protein FACS1894211_12680 [Clostridia bacterium]|nr:hypothetical protein FACS1894211_12680 [Clostridia bacterium]